MNLFDELVTEKTYKYLMEQYPGMVFIIDTTNRKIVDVNSKVVDFYGYTYEELIGKDGDDINTYSKKELQLEMDIAKRQDRNHFKVVHRTKAGVLKNVNVNAYPIQLEDKTYMFSVATERKSDELLQNIDEGLGNFITNSTDAICLVNSDDLIKGEIVFVNRSFTRLFRLDKNIFLHKKFSSLFEAAKINKDSDERIYLISLAEIIKEVSMELMTFRNNGTTYSLIKMRTLDYRCISQISFNDRKIDLKSVEYGNSPGFLLGIELYSLNADQDLSDSFVLYIKSSFETELINMNMAGSVYEKNGFLVLFTTEDLTLTAALITKCIKLIEVSKTYPYYKYKFRIGVSQQSTMWDVLETTMRHSLNGFLEGQYNHCIYYNYHLYINKIGLLQEDIEHGLLNEEFILYCQPIVSIDKQCISGIEMLIRWNHPVYGLIYPNDFLPKAKHSDQIIQIDCWVVKKSLELIKTYQSQLQNIKVHVNVSPKSLVGSQLIPIIDQYKDDKILEQLIIEITEESDTEILTKTFSQLQSYGIPFAIDDFGTGFSSFERIRQAGVKVVKIDRSFIKNIASNQDDLIILDSVIKMCKSLNIEIVAEGVETVEQLEYLKDFECGAIQGYYFCKPLNFYDFADGMEITTNAILTLLNKS